MSSPLSTNLEAILDRFDEAWNKPPPPPIEDQVMKGGWRKGDSVLCRSHESQKYAVPLSAWLLIELVRIDLERRLAAEKGQRTFALA